MTEFEWGLNSRTLKRLDTVSSGAGANARLIYVNFKDMRSIGGLGGETEKY